MTGYVRAAVATAFSVALFVATPALAQKPGGILRISRFDSPASMSMLEETTGAANRPMPGVFNNLVMYKQDVAQANLQSIIPDLATSWSWSEDGSALIFPLRQGSDGTTANRLSSRTSSSLGTCLPIHRPTSCA